MNTDFNLVSWLRSWFHAKDAEINTGGKDINTGGGDVIVGAGLVDGVNLTTHVADTDAHHNESHTIASHSDTSATGSELNTLTDGSDASSLHDHDGRYFQESEFNNDTGANSKPLETNSSGELTTYSLGADYGITVGGKASASGQYLIVMAERSAGVSTPASGYGVLWVNTSGELWFKNDAGTATQLA